MQTRPLTVPPCETGLFLGVWKGSSIPFMHSLLDVSRVSSVLYSQGLDQWEVLGVLAVAWQAIRVGQAPCALRCPECGAWVISVALTGKVVVSARQACHHCRASLPKQTDVVVCTPAAVLLPSE